MGATKAQIDAAYEIDATHRVSRVNLDRDSVICGCGYETDHRLGLAEHRAQLIADAVVSLA